MALTIKEALQQGVEAHKAGQLKEADRMYTAILKTQPQHSDANHNLGILALQLGKTTEAIPFFEAALKGNATVEQYWLSYLKALLKLDRLEEAQQAVEGAHWWKIRGPKLYSLEKQLKQKLAERDPEKSSSAQAPSPE